MPTTAAVVNQPSDAEIIAEALHLVSESAKAVTDASKALTELVVANSGGYWANVDHITGFVSAVFIALTAVFVGYQVLRMKEQIEANNTANSASIEAGRQNARQKATLEMINHTHSNPTYLQARDEYHRIRDAEGEGITKYAHKPHSNDPKCATIRTMLNHYELMATGIEIGILDEDMYKRYFRTSLIEDWTHCKAFVTALRQAKQQQLGLNQEPPFFVEFETLAKRWMAENK